VDAPATVLAGRYRLVNRLATGGMGSVWEGWDELLQRPVAVKQLLPQNGVGSEEAQVAVDRAMREARITARLHHPNAVPVYDVVEHLGRPCLIMQYVPSRSLQEILNERGVLEPAVVAGIGADISSALAAAHEAGIVHRDVKPSNVLITEDGSAKLTDFGVSHASGDVTLTSVGMVTGTPAYLAPEVARGARTDAAADVFSLGATLYAVSEGSPPFGTAENAMALMHRVAAGHVHPPSRSGPLAPLLMRMLAANPGDRPTMAEASHALAGLRADLGSARDATRLIPPTAATAVAPGLAAPIGMAGAEVAGAGMAGGEMAAAGLAAAQQHPTAALPVVPPAGPPPAPGTRPPGARPPGRGRGPLIAALVVAALLALGLVLGLLLAGNLGGSNHPRAGQQTSSAPGRPSSRASTRSSPPPSTSAEPTTSPPTSSADQEGDGNGNGNGNGKDKGGKAPTDEQLAQAITDYYALLPGNTDQAWDRLTKRYQDGTAKSRDNYQSFWDQIASVDTSDVSGSAPGSAEATITYTYQDGRVVIERTAFTLVQQDGVLKIDSSDVLDSQTQ
jgi:hypothetical protein